MWHDDAKDWLRGYIKPSRDFLLTVRRNQWREAFITGCFLWSVSRTNTHRISSIKCNLMPYVPRIPESTTVSSCVLDEFRERKCPSWRDGVISNVKSVLVEWIRCQRCCEYWCSPSLHRNPGWSHVCLSERQQDPSSKINTIKREDTNNANAVCDGIVARSERCGTSWIVGETSSRGWDKL